MSVRTLNRRFKAATNKSPTEYLQSIRLGEAKGLLKDSNLNIAEIADQVGYYDSSYFTELFTKAYGLNPKEYRRLVRNKQFRVNQDSEIGLQRSEPRSSLTGNSISSTAFELIQLRLGRLSLILFLPQRVGHAVHHFRALS